MENKYRKLHIFITNTIASFINIFNGARRVYFLQIFLRDKIIDYVSTVLYSLQIACIHLILFNAIDLQSMVGNDCTSNVTKAQKG